MNPDVRQYQNVADTDFSRLALLPGAFKPPHGVHLATVTTLLAREDIDQVVVVISRQWKKLPGTTKVIDADASATLWREMLTGEKRVQVVVAPDNASEHATKLSKKSGQRMSTVVSTYSDKPHDNHSIDSDIDTLSISDHASSDRHLRALLAQGDKGRDRFISLLSCELSESLSARLWALCWSELRDIKALAKSEVVSMHEQLNIRPDIKSVNAGSTSRCLEFDAYSVDGKTVRIKHVGNEEKTELCNFTVCRYPRERLFYANKALRWLAQYHAGACWFPVALHVDETLGISSEARNLNTGHSLMSDFVRGQFDSFTAMRLGEVLAELHSTPIGKKALHRSQNEERSWWNRRLEYWGERLDLLDEQNNDVSAVFTPRRCLVHLDLDPRNITVCEGEVEITGFECASSLGDPALDVLVIVSSYHLSGSATGKPNAANRAANSFLSSYRNKSRHRGTDSTQRALQLIRSRTKIE